MLISTNNTRSASFFVLGIYAIKTKAFKKIKCGSTGSLVATVQLLVTRVTTIHYVLMSHKNNMVHI